MTSKQPVMRSKRGNLAGLTATLLSSALAIVVALAVGAPWPRGAQMAVAHGDGRDDRSGDRDFLGQRLGPQQAHHRGRVNARCGPGQPAYPARPSTV